MPFSLPEHIDPRHCIVTKQYAVYTPPMHEMIGQIGEWIDQQCPGGYIYGASRLGKSRCVQWYVANELQERFKAVVPLVVWNRRPDSQTSEAGFWHQLLLASRFEFAHPTKPPKKVEGIHLCKQRLIAIANNAQLNYVVLLIDEAQDLTFREWKWLVALALHPDKTRLPEFGRYAAANRQSRGLGRPETFTFLGFIFICGKSRRGAFQLQRKTRGDRMREKLRQVKEVLRRRMHDPIPVQGKWLRQVVRGYFAYHAVPTNSRALGAFRHHVVNLWRRTLKRRSQKDAMTWERITRIANTWLPRPRILHPWPDQRFAVKHPR
ncbi:ATP-binding protein [Paraburkholderia mimosarum]